MPGIKIFIASSSRYKPLSEKESAKKARKRSAENAQNLIDGINQRFQQVKVVPWWDCSCFGKEEFLLDSLRTISMEYNIGIFILGPDEILDKSQGKPNAIPNSNVMFEMGMFASLGKPTFVIKDGWDKVILPSDLQGKYIFSFLEKERFYESLSNCINGGKYKSENYKGICLYHSESLVSKLGNRTQYQNWDTKALYMGSKCTHLWAAIEKERNYKEVTFVRILIEAMQNSRNKGLKKALASVNNIISFGPGAGRVDLLLKNLFVDVNPKPSYIPVDINVGLACTASSEMMGNKYPTPFAIIDDIEEPAFYSRLRDFIDDKKLVIGSVNLFSMLGVTFSNLSIMTEDFLSNLKDIMVDKNDLFLLDVIRYDERKDSNSIIYELKSQLLNNNNYWALLKNTIQKKFPNSKKEDDDAIKLKMSIIEDPIKDPAAKRCFRCYYSDDSSNTILLAKHYDFKILESCIIEKGFKIVYKYDSQDCGRCGYLFKLNNKK